MEDKILKSSIERFKRTPMPKQPPEVRIHNFNEVALGFTPEQAINEAKRCLQCPEPKCIGGCPVEIDIPSFIKQVAEGDFEAAIKTIRKTDSLPAITGRVCPQEVQCEGVCVLAKRNAPIAIGALERFVADYELSKGGSKVIEVAEKTGRKVAVVGSGPAGLTVAGDLAKLGHEVTIFEALHAPGGVLAYGIPEFRLPKSILNTEVNYVKQLGAEIKLDVVIGRTLTIEELFEIGFNAVFIGTGAGSPKFLNIPGEELNGVYSANEFLTRCNLMKAYKFGEYDTPIKVGENVTVVGAGNTAMDSARTALRLGAASVTIVYRRTEAEMPARAEEIENAKEEGVKLQLLTNPIKLLGENGWVKRMECIKMQLGEADESGRRRPVPIPNSNFYFDTDQVIIAIGRYPNPIIAQTTKGLEVTKDGLIITDELGRTSRKGIWAGGDIVTGEATVISAMGAGKKAAKDIHKYLMKL
ncbi:NADPH-dependent glutamate synthase [Candidatus Bathyarchaeota archaeon]|nr:NADPH-dependent glutamate synthase [Candidatus Bathyarchaeota archaeon]